MSAPAPELTDEELLADHRLKPNRLTVLLFLLILVTAGFAGGALVQKHWGASSSGGSRAPAAGGFTRGSGGEGFPAGGFGGAGFGGGTTGGTAGAGTAGAGTAGGGTSSATPVVVGTVSRVSGTTLTVKNFAGKAVTVKVPTGASVSLVAGKSLPALEAGATVSVAGTTAADGTVTATSVTVRS